MTEKHPTREAAARQYLAQRCYFGQSFDEQLPLVSPAEAAADCQA